MASWFSATAVTPEFTRLWSINSAASAALTSSVQAGFVLGALIAAVTNLPDVLPARWLMGCSAMTAAICNASLLIAPSYEFVVAARLLTGAALAGVYPPALKLIATWFVRGRSLALGAVIGALAIGSASPHLLRGLASLPDWHLVVAIASGMTLLGALLLGCFGTEGPFAFDRAQFDVRQIGRVIGDRNLALINLGYFGHMWELYAMWSWFLVYITAVSPQLAQWSSPQLSLVTFCVISIGAVGCLAGGFLAEAVGRSKATILLMVTSGVCSILVSWSVSLGVIAFMAVSLVWGVAIIGDSALFSAMTSEQADRKLVGTALTIQMAGGFAVTIFSILLVPAVASVIGWRWSFLVLAPPPLLGAVAIYKASLATSAAHLEQR